MNICYKIKVLADVDTLCYVDEVFFCEIEKNSYHFLSFPRGEYIIDFVCKVEPSLTKRVEVILEYDKILHVNFEEILKSSPSFASKMELEPVQDNNGLWGYLDRVSGIVFIPYQFESASRFEYWIKGDPNSYAEVILNGRKKVIKHNGKYLVDYDYDSIQADIMFWAICGDDDRQYIHSFFVETTSRNYIINTNGDILGSFTKEVLINHDSFFTNGVLIYRAHLRQFVDFSGKSFVCADHIGKVISWKRRAFYFVVKRNGKWGLIDINNRDIVPCQFDTYNLKEEGSDPDLPECCHHPLDSYFEIVFKSKDENLERAVATIYRLYYGALIQHQKYSEGMERNPFYTNGYDGEPFLVPYKEYRNEKVVFDDAMGHLRVIPIEELSGDYLLNHCLKPVFKKESE